MQNSHPYPRILVNSHPIHIRGKLFIVQKKIVRAITFIKSKDHSAPLMKSCNVLNIPDTNKYMASTFVYKCVKGSISLCEDWFRHYRNIYNTSSILGDPLFVPQYLIMHSRQLIVYSGSKIYNDVPMEIKSLNNPESFKYNLKNFHCCDMHNLFNSMF